MFRNDRGFTLIEMLIVLVIISILIILFVPNLSNRSQKAHEEGCKALIQVVQAQVDLYRMDHSEFPAQLDDLVDEYITDEQLTCPGNKDLQLNYDHTTGKVSHP